MGLPVLILGESGSGKTYAIKNLPKEDTVILSVEKNRLPFRDVGFSVIKRANYKDIAKTFNSDKRIFVVDDSQYLLCNELFDRVDEVGYKKFTQMAKKFRDMIHYVNDKLPDNKIVFFNHHPEMTEDGKMKAKTVGKMLDQNLGIEGCFDIVLYCCFDETGHWFLTQKTYNMPAKTPEGMFDEDKIPNDFNLVIDRAREYGWI